MNIVPTATLEDRVATEKEVDEEIAKFDQWFQSTGNDPLIRSEAAIIKTFLYFKLYGEKHGT
jgi:hypothetical protein